MFKQVDHKAANQLIREDQNLIVADVRDIESFVAGHIPGAVHLSMEKLRAFVDCTDKSLPILLYCFHGISSQAVAKHFIDQGFSEIYSLEGGFESWRTHYPVDATDAK
jgi:thiosulfate sulfurtransferase